MDGSTKMAGAVAGLKHIKNPAKLARADPWRKPRTSSHWPGGRGFAKTQDHEFVDNEYLTPKRKQQYERWKQMKKNGTVGVVVWMYKATCTPVLLRAA